MDTEVMFNWSLTGVYDPLPQRRMNALRLMSSHVVNASKSEPSVDGAQIR